MSSLIHGESSNAVVVARPHNHSHNHVDLVPPNEQHLVHRWKALRRAVQWYQDRQYKSGVYVVLWPSDNDLGPKGLNVPEDPRDPVAFHCGLPYIMNVDYVETLRDARGVRTVRRLVGRIHSPHERSRDEHHRDYVPEADNQIRDHVPIVTYAVRRELTTVQTRWNRSVSVWDNARMYAFDTRHQSHSAALDRAGEVVRRVHEIYQSSTMFSSILLAISNLRGSSMSSANTQFLMRKAVEEYQEESRKLSHRLRHQQR